MFQSTSLGPGRAARQVAVVVAVGVTDADDVVLLAGERALGGILGVLGRVVPFGEHGEAVPQGGIHAGNVEAVGFMALKYLTASAYISLTGSNLVLSAALPELVEVVDRTAVDLLLGLHAVGVVKEGAGFGDLVVEALDLGAQDAAVRAMLLAVFSVR
jgi:hypothetical protein